jgi:hypothetical protein
MDAFRGCTGRRLRSLWGAGIVHMQVRLVARSVEYPEVFGGALNTGTVSLNNMKGHA